MKYAVIVTNTNGDRTSATVKAGSLHEAWQKLLRVIPAEHIQAVEMAEILTPKSKNN